MRLNPYLSFDGQCEAAFTFYAQCLRGEIAMIMRYGDSPVAGNTPPELRQRILHVTLTAGDMVLQGSDAPSDRYQKPQGIHVMLGIEEPAQAEQIFHALSDGGTVSMPIQETFWAQRFGMLVDRFGIPWMVNCGKSA
jgi:PhnB protein